MPPAQASIEPDPRRFRETTLKMLGVAFACAIFTGIRGGVFTVRGGGCCCCCST